MNYNAQLCKTAWGKVFVALIGDFLLNRKRSRAYKTFGALARSGNWNVKRSF